MRLRNLQLPKVGRFIGLNLLLIFILSCVPKEMITIRKSNGEELKVKVEYARTQQEHSRGLMFRQKLPEDQGMLFIFASESSNSFWMRNTPLPLDIIFSHYGKIVDITERAQPYSEKFVVSHSLFTEVLEVGGGYVSRHGIKVGDQIIIP